MKRPGTQEKRAVSPTEILVSLRQFRKALKSGKITVKQGGRDRTQREIENLESDIAFVQGFIRQQRGQGNWASGRRRAY